MGRSGFTDIKDPISILKKTKEFRVAITCSRLTKKKCADLKVAVIIDLFQLFSQLFVTMKHTYIL